MTLHRIENRLRLKGDRGGVSNRPHPRVVCSRKHRLKGGIDPFDDFALGAKVIRQLQTFKRQVAQTVITHSNEQTHICFAKAIDRLHRIADQK